MKTLILTFASIFTLISLSAQVNIGTELNRTSETDNSLCVSIDLHNTKEVAMRIEGQNVRVYYDSDKLAFDKVFMDGMMTSTAYEYELVMNKSGLSKDEVDQLSFDNHMGFLNFAITARDEVENQSIIESQLSFHAQTVCFTKKVDEISSSDIVLARKGVTDGYSKAFVVVEASPVNEEILSPMNLMQVERTRALVGLDD